jgi:acylphosphatase
MIKQFEIRIYGRVQGVGFRYSARLMARSLSLKGWVENRPDGSVLTTVQGSEADCHRYIQWCRKGSGYSWVEHIEISEQEPADLPPFTVRH